MTRFFFMQKLVGKIIFALNVCDVCCYQNATAPNKLKRHFICSFSMIWFTHGLIDNINMHEDTVCNYNIYLKNSFVTFTLSVHQMFWLFFLIGLCSSYKLFCYFLRNNVSSKMICAIVDIYFLCIWIYSIYLTLWTVSCIHTLYYLSSFLPSYELNVIPCLLLY